MFGKKKGQTAMEYLMTYGWAILAVVVVGGILYTQTNIFSPGQSIPKQGCPGGQISIQAADWSYNAGGTFDVIVGNRVGNQITITDVAVNTTQGHNSTTTSKVVPQGEESGQITVQNLTTGSTGDSVQPTITVTYDVTDGLDNQKYTCEVTGSIS